MSEATEETAKAPETKAQLVQFIKSWIETDNEMLKLEKQMKTLRDNKKTIVYIHNLHWIFQSPFEIIRRLFVRDNIEFIMKK